MIDLIRPLFDARLWLALALVAATTWLVYAGKLDSTAWAALVSNVVWWAGSGRSESIEKRGMR